MTTQRRWSRVQKQILVWAGDEPLQIMYSGDMIVVPPRHEVARVGPTSIYRRESAQTRDGQYIPGTLLVADEDRQTEDGGYMTMFQVRELCNYLDRERQDLMKRGFAIVTDPEDVTPLMREQLIPLWEASMDARAREIINTELERRKKLEAKGNPLTAGSSEHHVVWAFRHMAKRQAEQKPLISTDDLFKAASGVYVPSQTAEEKKPAEKYVAPGDPKSLYAEAKSMQVRLSKAEVEGLMENDEDAISAVTEKLRERRKELEELAAEA